MHVVQDEPSISRVDGEVPPDRSLAYAMPLMFIVVSVVGSVLGLFLLMGWDIKWGWDRTAGRGDGAAVMSPVSERQPS